MRVGKKVNLVSDTLVAYVGLGADQHLGYAIAQADNHCHSGSSVNYA